jgi:integrase
LKLSAITRVQVASVHSHIGAEHPRTANKVLALVSSVFGRAAEWGLWDKYNPAKSIKKFKERSRDRFLQPDELPHFFQAVAEEPNGAIRDYVLLSLLTGARRSNVLAMRWEAISFGRGEWCIPETETKNGTPQVVTLSPEALAILANRKPAEATGHVFLGPGKPDTWKSRGRAGSAFWRVRVSKTCVSMTCAERWGAGRPRPGHLYPSSARA